MFQKFTLYRLASQLPAGGQLEEYLSRSEFAPTASTQARSFGWIPPRVERGVFIENVGGQLIAKLLIETRAVPSDAVQRRIDEQVALIEEQTGRKPGRKERRELKEDAVIALLPQAFPKRVAVPVWFDVANGMLVIGSTSTSQLDDVITALVRSIPDFAFQWISTQLSPAFKMMTWLNGGADPEDGFEVGRDCQLKASDESKAVVRYKHQDLDRDDVREHIAQGKMPTSLALTFDNRVSFVFDDAMRFKSVEILDVVLDQSVAGTPLDDLFDGDVAIETGELTPLIAAMLNCLGGIVEVEEPAPKTGEQVAPSYDGDGVDPLIDRARAVVISYDKASISLVQRHLWIGYNRAARLMEALEVEGVVSPMQSDGSRKILNFKGPQ